MGSETKPPSRSRLRVQLHNFSNISTSKNAPAGNELSGSGVGTRVTSAQYADDAKALKNIVLSTYKDVEPKPLVIAPAGFFVANWFKQFIEKTAGIADVITHHIYNLGPGVDEHLIEKILNPDYLDGEANTFSSLENIIKL